MKRHSKALQATLGMVCFAFLILDSKSSLRGGLKGIELCLNALIPSLFPFIFLSIWTSSRLSDFSGILLRPIGRLCGIPKGCESLLLISFMGGYPVGAQTISRLWENKSLDSVTAKRLLGFCNLAGPSFIFGVLGQIFQSGKLCLLLWLTQVISAILTAILLPKTDTPQEAKFAESSVSLTNALQQSIVAMSRICGWTILFRIAITVLDRWLFWIFNDTTVVLLTGILELSNGAMALHLIDDPGLRFILAAALLSFGGLCVYMQTCSVTGPLGTGMYIPGKVIQALISTILAILITYTQTAVFYGTILSGFLFVLIIILMILHRKKIIVAFSRKRLYNQITK